MMNTFESLFTSLIIHARRPARAFVRLDRTTPMHDGIDVIER